jgi:hypothetical protein
MATTRTIGPLHLEDLEPHRFEDLIRQLIYDLRNWRIIEATGRAGSDDGFDARATEILEVLSDTEPSIDDSEEDEATSAKVDRVWLVQCKREKSIGPKKLVDYLDGIPEPELQTIHGIIFAAACDFSKAARDAFRQKARSLGVSEAILWGKAEVEDLLFQPKNDHLLFAYFGVSLQIRRRSMRTEIRSRLSAKRKAIRFFERFRPTLIRDASDERYPYAERDKSLSRFDRSRWKVFRYEGPFSDGLRFICNRHFAYLGPDGVEWDYAECMNDGPVDRFENPWHDKSVEDYRSEQAARSVAMDLWDALSPDSKAWYQVIAVLPYENIVDIDEKGDECFGGPHIYTTEWSAEKGPFIHFLKDLTTISNFDSRHGKANEETRVAKVPRRARG